MNTGSLVARVFKDMPAKLAKPIVLVDEHGNKKHFEFAFEAWLALLRQKPTSTINISQVCWRVCATNKYAAQTELELSDTHRAGIARSFLDELERILIDAIIEQQFHSAIPAEVVRALYRIASGGGPALKQEIREVLLKVLDEPCPSDFNGELYSAISSALAELDVEVNELHQPES